MSRRPADDAAIPGQRAARAGREGVWDTIRQLQRFTVPDLQGATRLGVDSIRDYLHGLVAAGYVRALGPDTRREQRTSRRANEFLPTLYELIRDAGPEAPRLRKDGSEVTQGRGRDHMWRAAKMLTTFDARDLAVYASTEECAVSEADSRHYCQYLAKAGYLAVIEPGGPGRLARYRFVASRNTGPRAPMVQRVRQVYDPNLGRVVWRPEDAEGAA
jgi:hypothetical protein